MRYFRCFSRLWRDSKVEGFRTMAERRMRAWRMKRVNKTGGDAIGGAQVGCALAPAIEDQQLMPEEHRFGDNGTETPGACQAGHGDDHVNT